MLRKIISFLFIITTVLALPRPDDDSLIPQAEICLQPAEKTSSISCFAAIPKWTFNSTTSACEKYIYGGCGGTENLFDKELDCLLKCNRKALLRPARSEEKSVELAPADEPTSSTKSPCLLPVANGTCRAHITVFHFDAEAKACKPFIYTGCHGNENNFATEEDCRETCQTFLPVSAVTLPAKLPDEAEERLSKKELCSLPPVKELPISCLGFMPMWTHNSKTNKCESYVYGGCGKTANLFPSEEACNKACGPETIISRSNRQRSDNCLLPVTAGPCFGFKPRFGFRKDKNRCERFVYGGCQGNPNNFRTAEECFDACGGNQPSTTPECEMVTCPVENNRYIERGCLPVYSDNSCCPTSFDCFDEDNVTMCHYRGIPFQVGQDVPLVTQDIPCKTHCRCEKSDSHTGGATIMCNEIFCGWPQKPHNGCVLYHGPDQCCPSYKCSENLEATEPEVCNHNGKQYALGEYINTGLPCKACTCAPGFSGLDGPGCRDIHCLVDNRIDSVPIYTKSTCCPIGYKRNVDLIGNSTTIIRATETAVGDNRATTMPIMVPENWQVKSKICLLPKVIGPCKKADHSFYYDSEANECRSFIYGGCQGNENRFESIEACLEACRVLPAVSRAIAPQSEKDGVSTISIQIPENLQVKSSICLLPKVVGPCKAAAPSFYYNSEENECQFFTYGGCHGNANRFPTKEACLEACREIPPKPSVDVRTISVQPESGKQGVTTPPIKVSRPEESNRCYLPKEVGPCRMALAQFYYDADSGECIQFYYGGCEGNENRFDTVGSCIEACTGSRLKVTRSGPFISIQESGKQEISTLPIMINSLGKERDGRVISVQQSGKQGIATLPGRITDESLGSDRCQLPMTQGPCRMAIEQFYYDAEKGECFIFYYGGCKGNANRFNSPKECNDTCRGFTKVEQERAFITIQEPGKPGISTLPARIDSGIKRDGPFISVQEPGKLGVSTLPATSGDDLTDGNICSLPQETGPCRASIPSYSYNAETGTCESFWYGGCRGNANRFHTEEACLARCDSSSATSNVGRVRSSVEPIQKNDRCQMPADVGFCRRQVERFYYDTTTKECKTFIWGGCLGNANNFGTQKDCLAVCTPVAVMLSGARGAARINGDQSMTIGARARARTVDPVCVFGNLTLNLGDEIHNDDPCEVCKCETPPEITCTQQTCPSAPPTSEAICEYEYIPGQCCPVISCVSANPPSINVCDGVECGSDEHCEVHLQESPDGNWIPPIGVCVPNEQNCHKRACPPLPSNEDVVCSYEPVAGQCCSNISCVPIYSQLNVDGQSCGRRACPSLPSTPGVLCHFEDTPGQCCPRVACVPSASPTTNTI